MAKDYQKMMICLLKLRTSAGGHYCTKSWGYGGMVDAEDLKSFGYCNRVGSSPTIPTTNMSAEQADFF